MMLFPSSKDCISLPVCPLKVSNIDHQRCKEGWCSSWSECWSHHWPNDWVCARCQILLGIELVDGIGHSCLHTGSLPLSVPATVTVICSLSPAPAISTLVAPFSAWVYWESGTKFTPVWSQFITSSGGIDCFLDLSKVLFLDSSKLFLSNRCSCLSGCLSLRIAHPSE